MTIKGLTMIRRGKRLVFVYILIGLLVCGLTWSGLGPVTDEPNQVKTLNFGPSTESPLRDSESYPAPQPIWQDNENNIAFLQSVTVISSNKVPIKSFGNVRSALHYCHHNSDSNHAEISLRIIDSPNTVFKFVDGQIYQHLDIPPPHALASL